MDDLKEYWLGRWTRAETAWHQSSTEPELIKHFKDVKPTGVLVPLCGKSLDLLWLAAQGHEVVGVELSEFACESFFTDNNIEPKISKNEKFTTFTSDKITLICGDFFKLSPSMIGQIGAVYDRAALVALSPAQRTQYVAQLKTLIRANGQSNDFMFLQLLWERIPNDLSGPPYSITFEDLQNYYGDSFDITQVKKEEIKTSDSPIITYQSTFLLKPLILKST